MRCKSRFGYKSFVFVLGLLVCGLPVEAKDGLKVYISVDMEGITGVVTPDQLGPSGFEYARFRKFMTQEVLAAIRGARKAGATDILVSDSHGNGENLLIEEFPPDVRIIRSWPRRFSMMAGIDSTFDAVLFIGYHASTNNPRGVRAHTFSSSRITRVALNGKDVPEAVFNAAIAGHFGVPVVFLAGDDAIIQEVAPFLKNIVTVETKKALSYHAAVTITPQEAQRQIEKKVEEALRNLDRFRPFRLKSPVEFILGLKHYRPAEMLAYLPFVERVDTHTIRYVGKTMLDVADFLFFITNYRWDLEP